MDNILVTSTACSSAHEVIGPVAVQISNRGSLAGSFRDLVLRYDMELSHAAKQADPWSSQYGGWALEQSDFDRGFYIGVQELRRRGRMLEADAIVGLTQSFTPFEDGTFVLSLVGTAVRLLPEQESAAQESAALPESTPAPAGEVPVEEKSQREKDAEFLRMRRPQWRKAGRCQYCGGFFKGGLGGVKVCSLCGMPKDY